MTIEWKCKSSSWVRMAHEICSRRVFESREQKVHMELGNKHEIVLEGVNGRSGRIVISSLL
jgi:hypothetical protein